MCIGVYDFGCGWKSYPLKTFIYVYLWVIIHTVARPKSNKGRYNFLIDKEVYDEFSKVCDELGLIRSKQLEIFMKKFLKERGKEQKEVKKNE